MVQFDNQNRQIKIKIVYYGPAVGGKTTSLQYIHRITDPEQRTKLYSLNTANDRTLFFDLLSLNLGRIRDFRLVLQVFTVPGQVQYDATRRTVLAGADGVVFVADSQAAQRQANLASLADLKTNLAANNLDSAATPLVFQYNKRDLDPVLRIDEMDAELNPDGRPSFASVATRGEGVLEVFTAIGERTLTSIAERLGIGASPQAAGQLRQQMARAMRPYLDAAPAAASDDVEITLPGGHGDETGVFKDQDLVAEAVRSSLAVTDLSSRLDLAQRQLERRVREMESISEFGRVVSNERDPAAVLRLLITTTIRLLQVKGASVLVRHDSETLREAVLHGFETDPLMRHTEHDGHPLAMALLDARTPCLLARGLDDDTQAMTLMAVENAGFASAAAVPLLTQDKTVGLLAAYGDRERRDLDEGDLQALAVLGATAAMGYANAIAWRQMEELSQGLEAQVAERTAELRNTLAESRRLAADVTDKKALLECAYRDLAALDEVKNQLINRLSLEFRTPVTSLFTAAKVLGRAEPVPPDKAARLVTVIRDEAEKLLEMIESVFQASVLGGGAGRVQPSPAPAQELFRSAIAPLRDLARQRGVKVQVMVPNDLETVLCEAGSIEAALRAVIRNGIEFNHPGGEVRLEVRRVSRDGRPWLQLRVIDTGPGIPEADLPEVCSPFWQGDDTAAGKRYGIGLGLTIAKRVVENHGGELSITSTRGEGTRVVLSLPQ
jgi:signal transduction histidine kinase/signal recognition particle receptor subunit beta